ncbi:MAG: hypothetical protein JWM80_5470 [Cyanobacteria bacterium RYN_339]|nr:hypothetical protein [Cyanobacteria bacterium RYN_339]
MAEAKPRNQSSLTPVAALIALGVAVSAFVNNSDKLPAFEGLRPAVVKLLPGLQASWLLSKTYEVNGRAWKLASMTPVTDFVEADMVPVELSGHHRIFTNKARGWGANSRPYDRLYLELEPHVYAALRWRDVPD